MNTRDSKQEPNQGLVINWEGIDTVLLDMDGTLLDLHFDNYFWTQIVTQANQEHNNIDLERLLQDNYGTLNWYCIDYWERMLGIDIMSLKQNYTELICFRTGVQDFLDFLLARSIKPILVTNAHRKTLDLKMQFCPLTKWMDTMISSHDYGYAKEDSKFWQSLQSQISFNKQNTLLIDDNEAVLTTADNFGIKYCYSILKPDSQQTELNTSHYPLIDTFTSLYSVKPLLLQT